MGHYTSPTSFEAAVALVLEEIKSTKGFHRSAHAKRLEFAIDVCLVAHNVRLVPWTSRKDAAPTIPTDSTGYLVDTFFPPNPTDAFRALLMALREKSAVFKDILFWHHAPTMQSFLVHRPLLRDKITAVLGGARECTFIKLDKCPSVSRDSPDALQAALRDMEFAMAESPNALVLPLSGLFTEEILIPLAAVVIDYLVAYVPACPVQTSFLEGMTLDIYTVSLKWTRLAITCAEVSPGTVVSKLHVKFAALLERIGASVLVTHRSEALERVAL